jgi:lysine-specific demethylase/histidyl-hydroxylase NO66
VAGRSMPDLADPDRVFELYAGGATVVLQALHRSWPPLVEFCGQLADELGQPTQCNAYVTPPGSRGFGAHHDTHDVFVLQVDGTKRWHVYEPVLTLPLRSQPSAAYVRDGSLLAEGAEPVLSTVLGPGDTLYLPRGYIHAAETNEDRSIHLTVGVAALTWHDVLADAVTLAAEQEEFRSAVPADLAAEVPGFLQAVAKWLEQLPPERVVELVGTRRDRSLPMEPVHVLAQADAVRRLTDSTPVRARRGVRWSLREEGEEVVLALVDREIAMPAVVEPALRQVLDGSAYAAADLATSELDIADVTVLLRRLLRERAVVPAPGRGSR